MPVCVWSSVVVAVGCVKKEEERSVNERATDGF